MKPHSTPIAELLTGLNTTAESGLSETQVAQKREKFGENKLKEAKKKTIIRRFFEQFMDVMIIILLLAAVVSFVIAIVEQNPSEFFEPVLILLIVIINAVMGVIQESKAEKALDALKNMSAPHAKVLRDGKEKIISA
ncbi:MAG: ATPase, partial [Clostridia bacterium]|nr:ATPase [Clostridia bacterium]